MKIAEFSPCSPAQHLRQLWRLMKSLRDMPFDAQVDQLEHGLQCASRAWRDKASREWVLCALFHDIGRLFDEHDHARASTLILQPLLGPEALWTLAHHDVFMLRYAPSHLQIDREARKSLIGHPWFSSAAHFADAWDCRSFDPLYPTLPLNFFEPLLFDYAHDLRLNPVTKSIEVCHG